MSLVTILKRTVCPQGDNKPLVGISSCLMGNKVRYDGRDKFNQIVAEQVAPHVTLIALCPESMAGLGIPRPPVNLVEIRGQVLALGRDQPELDVTERLISMGERVARAYPDLAGFIVQSRSPSCGYGTTPVHDRAGQVMRFDHGLFVQSLVRALPGLPVLNDTDLGPECIHSFLNQIGVYP